MTRPSTTNLVAAAALVALGVVVQTVGAGILSLGVVMGSINALLAIGLVLVYRSSRIVNFAHGEAGGAAGVLTVTLIFQGVPYLLAVLAGLAAAGLIGFSIEAGVVRRFAGAPRLLLTVATIALAQILTFVSLVIPRLFTEQPLTQAFRTPLSRFQFDLFDVRFDGNHVMVVAFAVAVVIALTWFLNRTTYGIAIRAAAENGDRAALCGIPTKHLSTVVWIIAAALSASAFILQAPIVGLKVGAVIGPGLLLRGLAAAVIGRMESLPVTIAAAVGIGILEQTLFFEIGISSVVDALLLVVILAGLLLQRRSLNRVDSADASTWEAVGSVRPIPAELVNLPEVRWGRSIIQGVLLFLAIAVPATFTEGRQGLTSVIVIYAIVAVSLVVLTGWAGQISLGQFAFVGLGAAIAGTVSAEAGWDFVVSLGAGALAGMVAAVVLGLPALRLRGFFLAVTTLAFSVATSSYLLAKDYLVPDGLVERPMLFGRLDLNDELTYYYVCLATLGLVVAAVKGLRSSRMGRIIIAVRDNERSAQAYGASAVAAKLTAFAVSGAIAGLAGGLLVHQQFRLQATQYAEIQSLQAFTMAVIGGLGSLPGAVIGAVFVKGSQFLVEGPGGIFATGFGMLIVLLVLPKGLGSLVFTIRDLMLRRIAQRRGIVVASLLADVRIVADDEAADVEIVEQPLGLLDPEPVPG